MGDINAPLKSKDDTDIYTPEELGELENEDKTLDYLARVLTDVHRIFYEEYDSTKEVLVIIHTNCDEYLFSQGSSDLVLCILYSLKESV